MLPKMPSDDGSLESEQKRCWWWRRVIGTVPSPRRLISCRMDWVNEAKLRGERFKVQYEKFLPSSGRIRDCSAHTPNLPTLEFSSELRLSVQTNLDSLSTSSLLVYLWTWVLILPWIRIALSDRLDSPYRNNNNNNDDHNNKALFWKKINDFDAPKLLTLNLLLSFATTTFTVVVASYMCSHSR